MNRKRLKSLALLGAMSLLLLTAACGGAKPTADQLKEQGHEAHGAIHTASGDLQEPTASVSELPKFLDGQPEQIRLVYTAAGEATELLAGMPCYCGCMESAGHTSNLSCFIHEVKEDDTVVWDDHATRCGICLQIAAQSISMKAEGKTDQQIHATIDSQYKAS